MINFDEILRKHIKEYIKNDFPASVLDQKVDIFLCLKEEKEAILSAMKEVYNQALDDAIEYLDDNPEYDIQAIENLRK